MGEVFAEVLPSDQPDSPGARVFLDRAAVLMGLLLLRRLVRHSAWPSDSKVGVMDLVKSLVDDFGKRVGVVLEVDPSTAGDWVPEPRQPPGRSPFQAPPRGGR